MARWSTSRVGLGCIALLLAQGCTSQNPRDRFILAEKLWQEKNYSAAVVEYEKVYQKNPSSELGLEAMYRAATTQTLFLSDHLSALRKLNRLIELNPEHRLAPAAERWIGEILFSKLEQYEAAILQYERILQRYPNDPANHESMFRIGKSQFHLLRFDDAIRTFRAVIEKYPGTDSEKRARFSIGMAEQTKGHQLQSKEVRAAIEAFKRANKEYESFLEKYPRDELALEARFEIANCLEEQEMADAAYEKFKEILETYPNKSVVELKMKRILERKNQKRL